MRPSGAIKIHPAPLSCLVRRACRLSSRASFSACVRPVSSYRAVEIDCSPADTRPEFIWVIRLISTSRSSRTSVLSGASSATVVTTASSRSAAVMPLAPTEKLSAGSTCALTKTPSSAAVPLASTSILLMKANAWFEISLKARLMPIEIPTPTPPPRPADKAAAPAKASIWDLSFAVTVTLSARTLCAPLPVIDALGSAAILLRANTPPPATPTPLEPAAIAAATATIVAFISWRPSATTSTSARLPSDCATTELLVRDAEVAEPVRARPRRSHSRTLP